MSDLEFALRAAFELREEPWRSDASCRSHPNPKIFFPEGRGIGAKEYAEAKATCARCPVREACLEYAFRTGETIGVWGGLYGKKLRKARSEWKRCNT